MAGVRDNDAVTLTAWVAWLKPLAVAVTVADPGLAPVMVGCTAGVADPAAMKTEFAESDTRERLLEARLIVTPPEGATEDKVTCTLVVCPRARLVLEGICTLPRFETVMLAVAGRTFATVAVAVRIAVPELTPVTGTCTVVVFCAIATEAGTVAARVLLDDRFTVMFEGAAPDKVKIRFCCEPAPSARAEGVNDKAEPTTTTAESPVKPAAIAEIVDEPKATPVTVAGTAGAVLPAGMVTVLVTTTLDGVLLVRVIMTPPWGAALANEMPMAFVSPGATVTFFSTATWPNRLAFTGVLPLE